MPTIKHILYFLYNTKYVLIFLIILSCSKKIKVEDEIIGVWELKKAMIVEGNLDSISMSENIKRLESSYFTFKNDKHFEIEYLSSFSECYAGDWEYFKDKGLLVLFHNDITIDSEAYNILYVSRDSMVFKQSINSIGNIEFQFKKVQR
jgi:hypothetical protein